MSMPLMRSCIHFRRDQLGLYSGACLHLYGDLSKSDGCRFVGAYSSLVNPVSRVRLGVISFGESRGFGIFAREAIRKHRTIWEAVGMVPIDDNTGLTELSVITTAEDQNLQPGLRRVLLGPLRLVNHRCINFNAEVSVMVQ